MGTGKFDRVMGGRAYSPALVPKNDVTLSPFCVGTNLKEGHSGMSGFVSDDGCARDLVETSEDLPRSRHVKKKEDGSCTTQNRGGFCNILNQNTTGRTR